MVHCEMSCHVMWRHVMSPPIALSRKMILRHHQVENLPEEVDFESMDNKSATVWNGSRKFATGYRDNTSVPNLGDQQGSKMYQASLEKGSKGYKPRNGSRTTKVPAMRE